MRSKLSALVLGLSLAPVSMAASSVDQKLQDQQIEIDALSQELKRLKSSLALNTALDKASDDNVAEFMERMDVSAFLTAGIARTDQKIDYRIGQVSDKFSYRPDAIFGVQMTYKVNDKFDIVSQLVARGNSSTSDGRSDWQVEADWAYLAYKPVANLQLRAGRLRLPLYLYSDYLEVGYAYPWIAPPSEVYYEDEITTFEGVDVVYDMVLSDSWNLTMQAFIGSLKDNITRRGFDIDIDIDRDAGVNFSLSNGTMTFRAGHVEGKQKSCTDVYYQSLRNPTSPPGQTNPPIIVDLANDFCTERYGFTFDSVGFRYDGSKLLAIAEVIRFDNELASAAKTESGYLTLGYQMGAWLPHITYAKTYNFDDATLDASRKAAQTSITLGSRFNVAENVAVKVEVTQIDEFNGTKGLFDGDPSALDDEAMIYRLAVDATF